MSVKEDLQYNNRGFKGFGFVPSKYGGGVRAYESSSAEHPHIWVAIEEPEDLNAFMRGEEVPMNEAHAHLPIESAERLRDQLTYLIDNHYHKGITNED